MVRRFLVLVLMIAGACVPASAAPGAARLTKKQQAELRESIVPAYRLGNPALILERASGFVGKLDEDRLAAANRVLAENGLPSIDEMLADSRLTMVHQNRVSDMPPPTPRELLVTLRELNGRIEDTLAAQDKHPVMAESLPQLETLDEYQDLFWELHVLDNRLANAARIAQYAGQLVETGSKRLNPKSIDEAGKKLMATDFQATRRDIERRRREMEEREVEMRVLRIKNAASVLRDSKSSRDRFLATYVLDLDGHLVADFFRERSARPQVQFIRKSLADESLPQRVQQIVEDGRSIAGDLVKKTQLLYTGLHWWLRGRYGAGPEAFGLLKSRMALTSEAAQFPLYMPRTTPKPTNPMANVPQVPQVDRRHHYTWAVEYRPISSNSASKSSRSFTTVETGTTSTTHLSKFY